MFDSFRHGAVGQAEHAIVFSIKSSCLPATAIQPFRFPAGNQLIPLTTATAFFLRSHELIVKWFGVTRKVGLPDLC